MPEEPQRCPWTKGELYSEYHDREWGVPQHDDRKLFEMLLPEGAQAGLSWETILRKRENYREAFDGFDPWKISQYDDRRIARLLENPGIVRNRLKVRAAVANARAFLEVRQQFGAFDRYIWTFTGGRQKILARHFPEHHRGVANALLDVGSKMGPALGTLLGGLMVALMGWRLMFVVPGVGGMLWLIPWLKWRPRTGAAAREREDLPSIGEILRLRSAWGTIAGHFCANYFWFFLLTWLPMCLVKERGMSMERMAAFGSAVYFVMAAATVAAGFVADRWIAAGRSVTVARKTMTVSGLLLSTVVLPAAPVEDATIGPGLLLLGCAGLGVFVSSHWAITQTVAEPVAAGRWTSLQNGVGSPVWWWSRRGASTWRLSLRQQ